MASQTNVLSTHKANVLTNGRTFQVSLSSTAASTAFDGSNNISDIGVDGTLAVTNGGTGIATSSYKNAIIAGNTSSATGAFSPIRTNSGALFSTTQDGAASFGTLPVPQGGTGITTASYKNAIITGNSSTANSPFNPVRTNSGAFFSTTQDGAASFGTLPVQQGGTGITTSSYKNAIIAGNSTTATSNFSSIRTSSGALYSTTQDGAATFGTLQVPQGGTGQTSFTKNCAILSGDSTTAALVTRSITNNTSATAVSASTDLITANTLYYHKGNSNIVTVGTITSGTWNGTTIAIANGGTGKTEWTKGGIVYASATDTLSQIADGTADKVLKCSGSATYSWLTYTSANTASTIVYRDASGNFSAGTISASIIFPNNTWNTVGDDVYIGDCNVAGCLGIKGKNGLSGISFQPYTSGKTVTGKLWLNDSPTNGEICTDRDFWVTVNAARTISCGSYRTSGVAVACHINSDGTNHGIYSWGYSNGTTYTGSGAWLIYRDNTGAIICNGNANTATRIQGNLGAITDASNHNIWVSSGTGADGIPKYISGVYIVPSTKTIVATTFSGNATTASGLIDGSSTMTSAYNKAGLAYADYTWLAGWNGYELRAVNKSQFAQASHSHSTLDSLVTISRANHSNDTGIIVQNTDSTNPLKIGYIIGGSGNAGIYDWTHSVWKVQIAPDGTTTFNGNATSATKATQDGSGNTITSTYLKLSGGTMTGTLTLQGNQYTYKAGSLNCNNSNIIGVNGIFMADNCETFGEGINFYRSSTTCDAIAASSGVFYFGSNVGDAALDGTAAIVSARLHAKSSTDAVAGSVANVALITGPHTGGHMEFDGNEILAKTNASTLGTLYFQENCYVNASGKLYNAVWNDFAEYRSSDITEPGRVVVSDGKGEVILSTERLQAGGHVVSDTYGIAVGESDQAKTPLGVAGRVLVIPYQNRNNYHIGDCLCTAPNGTADIMTREEIIKYPDRIIGIVDEIPDYKVWDQSFTTKKRATYMHTEINDRIWIYVR